MIDSQTSAAAATAATTTSQLEALEGNDTSQCSNFYCLSPEDYFNEVEKYIIPTDFEWVFIALYILVFIVGILGNLLVVVVVCVEKWMRTVTNLFIVNLSVADFMVILFCLPTSVLGDVTETWYIGSFMCKVIVYLQGVSVSVSVLTLSAISVERYHAICHPLRFQATVKRTKLIIVLIWFVSFVNALPELIVVDIHTTFPPEMTIFLTSCSPTWDDDHQFAYQLFIVIFLFCLPLLLMGVAYAKIACRLWSSGNVSFDKELRAAETRDDKTDEKKFEFGSPHHHHHHHRELQKCSKSVGRISFLFKKKSAKSSKKIEVHQHQEELLLTTCQPTSLENASNSERMVNAERADADLTSKKTSGSFCIVASRAQVVSRKKVAKMLICVVIMFAVCYLPVHVLNILRYWRNSLKNQYATEFALVAHFLCYFNSAVNPLIYNFMSEKFQKAYKRVLTCSLKSSVTMPTVAHRRNVTMKSVQTDANKHVVASD